MSLFFLCLLALSSCCKDRWQHTSIQNKNAHFDIAKLSYPSTSLASGLELELARCGEKIYGYINIHTLELPIYEQDIHATTLTISTNCISKTFVISLLEGKQRARLSTACLNYLLQILEHESSITLTSGYFSQTLDASSFRQRYSAFIQVPSRTSFRNIIQFGFD